MKKISLKLNQVYKSFNNSFQYQFEGNLILLSGINGGGKSQIINILLGQEGKNQNQKISSVITLDDIQLNNNDIEFRSFKENINIPEITASNSQSFVNSGNQAWGIYQKNLLNPAHRDNIQFSDSCIIAKEILSESFSEQDFNQKKINIDEFKSKLSDSDFVWKQTDMFTNSVGEIFFNHALKVSEKMKDVGRSNFDSSLFDTAPWAELNDLFEELNLEYRFKNDYGINGVEINEQPRLFGKKDDGSVDEQSARNLVDLSDGEKTILSLCFASLSGGVSSPKKLLLLDEIDAVLNPSLIQTFFTVINKYFLAKGVMVIITTHSPATISLSPAETRYYEVFKKNSTGHRILEVTRDEYSELQIANKDFYDKIANQERRIKYLEGTIDSNEEVLIITEGKTDWKYMIRALKYFHLKNEFLEIKESYFYRFGSSEDVTNSICGANIENELSDSKLRNYLNGLIESRNIDNSEIVKKRIGIFDSDNKNVKIVNQHALGIYSFKISPESISTEFLFSDNEIKTEISGKRIYIGDEFDSKSNISLNNSDLSIGGNSQNTNKAGKRVIVDSGVYNRSIENVALTKEKYAQAVYGGDVKISEDSWNNFKHIFTKIIEYLPAQITEQE